MCRIKDFSAKLKGSRGIPICFCNNAQGRFPYGICLVKVFTAVGYPTAVSLRRIAGQDSAGSASRSRLNCYWQRARSFSQRSSTSAWAASMVHSFPGLKQCRKRPWSFMNSSTGSFFFGT